jgi:hypothetical protein
LPFKKILFRQNNIILPGVFLKHFILMKIISFFSRFTFICNICFLAFVFFAKLQSKKAVAAGPGTVVAFPFFKDLVIILGFLAIIINLLMCLVYLIILLRNKIIFLPKWLTITNAVFLLAEFYFFFFL